MTNPSQCFEFHSGKLPCMSNHAWILYHIGPTYTVYYLVLILEVINCHVLFCSYVGPYIIRRKIYMTPFIFILYLYIRLYKKYINDIYTIIIGARWCRGMFGALQPEGCGFEST